MNLVVRVHIQLDRRALPEGWTAGDAAEVVARGLLCMRSRYGLSSLADVPRRRLTEMACNESREALGQGNDTRMLWSFCFLKRRGQTPDVSCELIGGEATDDISILVDLAAPAVSILVTDLTYQPP